MEMIYHVFEKRRFRAQLLMGWRYRKKYRIKVNLQVAVGMY